MIRSLEIIFLIFVFSSLNFELCSSTCARDEYETNGLCCLMCAPGTRVYRDCTESSSTTCVPCIGSTFLDAPNGLKVCFSCTVCDPGLGLRVKNTCTQSSDTVCEPLEGHYCSEENRDSCIFALKHSKCSPGQYIKHIGTPFKDTECAGCAGGTFSNGSVQICQPHSKCEDLGLSEIKPGTLSSNAECEAPAGLIANYVVHIIILVALAAAAVLIFLQIKHKARLLSPCTDCLLGNTNAATLHRSC